jgi:hypothetical protein
MATRKKPPLDPRLLRAGARLTGSMQTPSAKDGATTKAAATTNARATTNAAKTRRAAAPAPTTTKQPAAAVASVTVSHPLVTTVITLTSKLSSTFYSLGVALRELSRPEVYGPLGYKSQNALLATEGFPHPRNARKAIAIVSELDEATALSLGFERAHSLVQYARRIRPNRPVSQFLATKPEVRIAGVRRPLVELTRDELEALRADHRRGDAAGEVHSAAKRAARALGQHFEHVGLESAAVTSARKRGGSVVRIQLSPEDATALAAILRDHEP